jgi:hypothetical protein
LLVFQACSPLVHQGLQACWSFTIDSSVLVSAVQAWLQKLVAAEADIPDGAVAHVLVGDRRLKATWQLESRCWEIAAGPAATASQLSVVYADQPLVRLLGGASTGTHRLSLLLQAQTPPAALQFLGSDAHSVIPPPTTSAPDVIYCTARGSWGDSLPVSVVAVDESEAWSPEGDAEVRHVLLTVSVASGHLQRQQAGLASMHRPRIESTPCSHAVC